MRRLGNACKSGKFRALFQWRGSFLSASGPPCPTTRFVLLTLSTWMDEKLHCFPSIATVALATGLSERTVLRHVHAARDEGWIVINTKAGSGRGWKRNEYVGTYPQGGDPVSVPKPQGGDTRSAPQARGTDPLSMRYRSSVHEVPTQDRINSLMNSSKNSSDSFNKETVEKKKKAYRDGVKKARGALERPSHIV